ncbi:uncharacterized protein LOC119834877 [Zerene cesonia]|uniref:uncharacterized protein LOC119834877 n=1 Tax=Zerene cesonia TaxID=33412 RepID=UPI0018E530F4|nr:uncharacterized protein LOC119834877 [Zerene cesonia]
MPPKDPKASQKGSTVTPLTSVYGELDEMFLTPRQTSVLITLKGDGPGQGEWLFLILFDGHILLETKWSNEAVHEIQALPIDLKNDCDQGILTDRPLTFLLRLAGGKGVKDPDPLLHVDNRAGGNVDLFPLVLGEEKVYVTASLDYIATGEKTGCSVTVYAKTNGIVENKRVPLTITAISAHCLSVSKEGTVYLNAIGLNDIHDPVAINFGMSLSSVSAKKVVWSSISNAGLAANTSMEVPKEDKYIPDDLEPSDCDLCNSVYWNAMKRVLVDAIALRERLENPFLVELAGVPKQGKIDVRGRYMTFIDARVLLQPGQYGVTTCSKLFYFNEADLPEQVGPLLELPPASAKPSVRDTDIVLDEFNHPAYIVMRFDLFECLVPKAKIVSLFEIMGFPMPEGPSSPIDELRADPTPEESQIDVRKIRKEGGALAVHKELCSLSCKGTIQMSQSIKRTAANRLLYRLRSMLKQFQPSQCSTVCLQDTITAQHVACRYAVTSSFAPQPPPPRPTSRVAATRSRIAGDIRIGNDHIEKNLRALPKHPRPYLCKALRCLENEKEQDARVFLLKALSLQARNRYLLWTLGAIDYDKSGDKLDAASAAFRIAVKGDITDGVTSAIGWAALHAFYHFNKNNHAAFVAAKKMRKSYELSRDWKAFLQRWVETSGEEETFWIPSVIEIDNPMIVASAFFLCLRSYKFSGVMLQCVKNGCASRGSRMKLPNEITVDNYYVQAASLLLRQQVDRALEVTEEGIKRFGPSSKMSQMRATCLVYARGWDGDCEEGLVIADRFGAEQTPSLLLRAALGGIKTNPEGSLQRAARAHKIAPSAHSALAIGRVYMTIGKEALAERWVASAVNTEPLLADAWAVLALLAMKDRNIDKARNMLRSAKQVGAISADIKDEVKKAMKVVHLEGLPEMLVKELCLCDYY